MCDLISNEFYNGYCQMDCRFGFVQCGLIVYLFSFGSSYVDLRIEARRQLYLLLKLLTAKCVVNALSIFILQTHFFKRSIDRLPFPATAPGEACSYALARNLFRSAPPSRSGNSV